MEVGKRNDALKCFEYFLDLKNNRGKTRLKTEKNARFFDKTARGFFGSAPPFQKSNFTPVLSIFTMCSIFWSWFDFLIGGWGGQC
jgi:hypothetical protein